MRSNRTLVGCRDIPGPRVPLGHELDGGRRLLQHEAEDTGRIGRDCAGVGGVRGGRLGRPGPAALHRSGRSTSGRLR